VLGKKGAHYAPKGKGWLLATALVAAAAGVAVAGGLRGGPDGKSLRLLSGTTTTAEPAPTTTAPEPTTTSETTTVEPSVATSPARRAQVKPKPVAPTTTARPRAALARTSTTPPPVVTTTTVPPDDDDDDDRTR
jgi:hypothetical protein